MPPLLVRIVRRAHFIVATAIGIGSFLGLSALSLGALVIFRKEPTRAAVFFARSFSGVMRAVLGWRIEVENMPTLIGTSPAVVVANHQSNLDVVLYGTIFPPRSVSLGKKQVGRIPFFGWLFTATGNILLDRENREAAIRSIDAAARRIRDERLSVWLFPEGHRNQGPELLPFKKGAFHLAIAAQVPVVVLVTEPVECVLDAERLLVRPGRIRMKVLTPIPTEGLTENDVGALLTETRVRMGRAREELRATARPRIA